MSAKAKPKRPVNVAVVGLGFMGVTHLQSYKKIRGAKVLAVCDAVRQPVNGVIPGVGGNMHGADALDFGPKLRAYQDYDLLLQDPDVDLIDLCVPTALHVEMSVAALKAGKHVICEKPLARDVASCRKIVNAAKKSKGSLMPAMCMRFWPGWSWLKDAVADERYGKVLAARFRRVSESPGWSTASYFDGSSSGGALLDLHIHDTDFIQFVFGKPKRVYAKGLTRFSGAIDHVVTQYDVANGAVVSAEGTWLMTKGHGFGMFYTFNFENATVDFDSTKGEEALRVYQEGRKPKVLKPKGGDGYIGELRHMIDSIREGKKPSIVTPEDALMAVKICETEEKSIATGKPEPIR